MEILEPYIKSGLPIALKADNDYYLCRYLNLIPSPVVLAPAMQIDKAACHFFVKQFDNDTISLQSNVLGRNCYLSRIDGSINVRINDDESSRFKVFSFEDGKIALQADNGKFLSRIHYVHDGTHRIEAAKDEIDIFSKFMVEPITV